MTRDTPLLEFSQVRATPIDGHSTTFMSAELLNESLSLLSPLFVVLSTYQRKRWTQKSVFGGDMKMGEGE